jgi:hypothetical protein
MTMTPDAYELTEPQCRLLWLSLSNHARTVPHPAVNAAILDLMRAADKGRETLTPVKVALNLPRAYILGALDNSHDAMLEIMQTIRVPLTKDTAEKFKRNREVRDLIAR